jgi:hypothetical protein
MRITDLLATCTIVAFMAATGVSIAQQERVPQHERGAPAEKVAPPGMRQPSTQQHQNGEAQNAPAGRDERPNRRTGEAPQNRGRPETTGQAPRSNERDSEQDRSRIEQRLDSDRERNRPTAPRHDRLNRGSEPDRTTGQGPRDDRTNRASEQNRFDREHGRTDRTEENRPTTTGQGAAGTRANIDLTPEKRSRIHDVIIHERNAPRVSRADFDVSIGARVPRTVRFVTVPRRIVEIEPAWRGFDYFMIGDEIVIVDPRSLEIVAIIEA